MAQTEENAVLQDFDAVIESWRTQLEPFREKGGEVGIQVLGRPPVLHSQQLRHLHLLVKEAIANSIRHSSGTEIQLVVAPTQDGCAVTVCDNGEGIRPEARSGLGTKSMNRWIRSAGGEMNTYHDHGTIVEFIVPSSPQSFWEWLQGSRRLDAGVNEQQVPRVTERWSARCMKAGDLQSWFRYWPRYAETHELPPIHQLSDWLDQQMKSMGARGFTESTRQKGAYRWMAHLEEDVDPIHWLDLGVIVASRYPLLLERRASENEIRFLYAETAEALAAPDASASFQDHLHHSWAEGLWGPLAELSSQLHDHLAQDLVAESMHWELACEQASNSTRKAVYDQLSHQLRDLAIKARSLSHEVDIS